MASSYLRMNSQNKEEKSARPKVQVCYYPKIQICERHGLQILDIYLISIYSCGCVSAVILFKTL